MKERRDALVERIRMERGCPACIPFFDPADGGVIAEVLIVLEAPGPKAIASGFVSCDNPDLSARNLTEFLEEAGIDRRQIVAWNIAFVGSEKDYCERAGKGILR